MKSTVEQIQQRFDKDVERFSNLETGQSVTIDALLVLELIARVAQPPLLLRHTCSVLAAALGTTL